MSDTTPHLPWPEMRTSSPNKRVVFLFTHVQADAVEWLPNTVTLQIHWDDSRQNATLPHVFPQSLYLGTGCWWCLPHVIS